MKFQQALSICCLVVVAMTIQPTSARFQFQDVTVNGTLLKWSGYCDFIGGKKLGSYSNLGQYNTIAWFLLLHIFIKLSIFLLFHTFI